MFDANSYNDVVVGDVDVGPAVFVGATVPPAITCYGHSFVESVVVKQQQLGVANGSDEFRWNTTHVR